MNAPRTSPEHPDYDGPDPGVLRCVIAYNGHGGYCVPRNSIHRPCAQTILGGGVFEPPTVAAFELHGRHGDIVHAGTYFGDMLPAAARACGESRIVWACEPNRENFRCAAITVAINRLTNVRLHHGALGDRTGPATVLVRSPSGEPLGGRSRVVEPDAALAAITEQVPMLRIDDLVPAERSVSLIQLDVERHERQALDGAMATIRRCLPAIIVETLPDDGWLATTLGPLGYRQGGKVGPNTLLIARPAEDVS